MISNSNSNIVLKQVVKNFSLFSFEALNIICENKNIEINLLRDKNGLDLLSSYILNGEFNSIDILKQQNYPLDELLNITEGLELSDYGLYIPFKNDRKETISLIFNPPLTSQITSLHLLTFLIFKNNQEFTEPSNFKISVLNNNLMLGIKSLLNTSKSLTYIDSEGYSVSDYICMFPTNSTLRLLINIDPRLISLSNLSIFQIPKLLQSYIPELSKSDDYKDIKEHIDMLILEKELQISCPINNFNKIAVTKF